MKDFNSILLGDIPSQPAPICNGTAQEMIDENNRLNGQIVILSASLTVLSKLGNGDYMGNSIGNKIAQDALNKVDTFKEWSK